MQAAKIIDNLKKYALIYGAGAVAALQSLKMELFSFPPNVRLYLGYLFSIIAVFCVFFGGSSIVDYIKKNNEIVQKMKDFDATKPPKIEK